MGGEGMNTTRSCPDDALLDQVHAGEIDALALERLAGHLDTCATCGERLHQRFLAKNQSEKSVSEQHDSLARQYARDKTTQSESPRWLRDLLARGPDLAKPPLSRPLEPGDLGSLGRYRILRVLGEGASSVVYQGFDPMLERRVVLKAYRPDYAEGPAGRQDMFEEARAFARVQDDHVVLVHEVAQDGTTLFLVMPYQEGKTLEAYLDEIARGGRKPGVGETLDLALQAALGLRAIHGQGLLHGDLKPSNVWISEVHGAKRLALLDLGLSTRHQGRSVGPYLAPEVVQGGASRSSDLYALGRISENLSRISGELWPAPVTQAMARLLSDHPSQRPDLESWISVLRQESEQISRSSGQRRVLAMLAVLVPVLLLACALAWMLRPSPPGVQTLEPPRPRGLAPDQVIEGTPGVKIAVPLLAVAKEAVVFSHMGRLSNLQVLDATGRRRLVNAPEGVIKAAWQPPYLALIDTRGVLRVSDLSADPPAVLLELDWASSVPSGLEWSRTDPPRLLLGRGNQCLVYGLRNAGKPDAELFLERESNEVAPAWLTPHTPVWIGWEPGRLQVNALMPPGGVISTNLVDKPVFSFRPVHHAPVYLSWSPDGDRFLVASHAGELGLFSRKIIPTKDLYARPTQEKDRETQLEIAELVWAAPRCAAIRLHGGNRDILLVDPFSLSVSTVPLDTLGKKPIKMAADASTGKLWVLAEDGTVMVYRLPANPLDPS